MGCIEVLGEKGLRSPDLDQNTLTIKTDLTIDFKIYLKSFSSFFPNKDTDLHRFPSVLKPGSSD